MSRPPDAAAGDGPRYVLLKYRRLAPGGNGALVHMVEHPFHRDAPISGGREEEPPATPVATTVKGLAIVRVEMPAGVGFTARIGDRTVDVVFMNPGPPEPEMLRLVEGIFQ